MRRLAPLLFAVALLNGCTVISNDRVFPKLAPFWTAEAKAQRESNVRQKETRKLGEALAKEWGGEAKK